MNIEKEEGLSASTLLRRMRSNLAWLPVFSWCSVMGLIVVTVVVSMCIFTQHKDCAVTAVYAMDPEIKDHVIYNRVRMDVRMDVYENLVLLSGITYLAQDEATRDYFLDKYKAGQTLPCRHVLGIYPRIIKIDDQYTENVIFLGIVHIWVFVGCLLLNINAAVNWIVSLITRAQWCILMDTISDSNRNFEYKDPEIIDNK